jgi:predicted nucleotidyltransferase
MENQIVEYLKDKYKAEAIILHGSRAKGKNRDNSDWDLIILTSLDIRGIPEEYLEQKLDVTTVRVPVDEKYIREYTSFLNTGRVLFDNKESLGEQIVNKAKEYFLLGKNLTKEEIESRKQYLLRSIDRMEGVINSPEMFFLYLGFFYTKAIQYWFEIKNRFSKPAYEAFEDIKSQDQNYYSLLKVLHSQVPNEQKLNAAKEIIPLLF